MIQVYIGIGSNLDNPIAQVQQAITELQQLPHSQYLKTSSLYQSSPLDATAQPDYINAVSLLMTALTPEQLLTALHTIEDQHGRVRTERWGPRTLDLDLLLYGEKNIRQPDLIVPHAGLHERSFVLYPLQELNPNLLIPGYGPILHLVQHCDASGLERLEQA